jgi:hypothetical protein
MDKGNLINGVDFSASGGMQFIRLDLFEKGLQNIHKGTGRGS